ncbi:MAG: aminopeptidase, partial [Patescibacteria group bacterium]|nr:aminopeptidase [Patescibacteria group bacterium]
MDIRNKKLAHLLVNYSTGIKKGERVWVDCIGTAPLPLLEAVVEEIAKAGGIPFYQMLNQKVTRRMVESGSESMWKELGEIDRQRMEKMDAYIGIRGQENIFQMAGVPHQKMMRYIKYYQEPVHIHQRVEHTRWVVLRYPNPAFAQSALMSDEAFENYYFDVCTLDYKKLSKVMEPLVRLLKKTNEIRLVGPGTDLTIGVKGMTWVKCDGKMNIPDGEVFTSPIKTEVNGTITYNTKTESDGELFTDIAFEIKNGKIIDAQCSSGNTKKLNQILDTDPGARYFGEFSFGTNPYITHEILDILFDEKIYGSNHLTPGNSYKECFNGNSSAVHWDLIIIGCDVYA